MQSSTFVTRCREAGGVETRTGFEFSPIAKATAVATAYGHNITLPYPDRIGTVVYAVDHLLLQVPAHDGDDCRWSRSVRKGYWSLVLRIEPEPLAIEGIRVVEYEGAGTLNQPDGTYIMSRRGVWTRRGDSTAIRVLMYRLRCSRGDAEKLLGGLHTDPTLRVCIPFAPEYVDGRWNIGAPQLRYKPEPGPHPHWNKIFDHVGSAVGADYLKAWFAAILQNPACRLPYLFLFGDENCGKSILWEAFALLVTGGVVKADRALTSEFNGELDGAILCVVEEKDISHASGVVERVKDAVTGLTLAVRRMFTDQYQTPNFTHWIQTSNNKTACLVPPGDTRITVIPVGPLKDDIPKELLLARLAEEGPAITHTLLTLTLPEPDGRLALPALETAAKAEIQEQHLPPLATKLVEFMRERTEWSGTAADLNDAIGGCPNTVGRISAAVSRFRPYLDRHNITAEFPEGRTKRGRILILRRD